ncbi:PAS domain-containing sensor histidine kinase [Limisalsivibrio acetivorans]|uniref:PAS domain-containing sensor histidine kinase n=1 Tax=Limisalsivibrio acetivorans TaxID=1304888 RepID=UPI0012DD149C|nr:PAS domain-containing sensor histidine kinase [Limisalsivibrio acetivorans]
MDFNTKEESRYLLYAKSLIGESYSFYESGLSNPRSYYLDTAINKLGRALGYLNLAGTSDFECVDILKNSIAELENRLNDKNLVYTTDTRRRFFDLTDYSSNCLENAEIVVWEELVRNSTDSLVAHERSHKKTILVIIFTAGMLLITIYLVYDRSRTLRRLRAEQKIKFRMLDMQPNMVTVTDGAEMLSCNRRVLEFLGYDDEETFKSEHDCICEFFLEKEGYIHGNNLREWTNKVIQNKEMGRESKAVMKDSRSGEERVFLIDIADFYGEDDLTAVSFTDITGEEERFETIAESERHFRNLFYGHSAVMLLINPFTGEVFDANSAAAEYYGYSLKELRNMNISDINCSEGNVMLVMANALDNKLNTFEFTHRLAEGELRNVEVHSSPVDIGGEKYLFSIVTDIHEKKIMEERLNTQSRLLKTIMDNTPLLMIYTDIKDNIIFANSSAKSAAELPEDTGGLKGVHFAQRLGMDTSVCSRELAGRDYHEWECSVDINGREREYRFVRVGVENSSGILEGFVCIGVDISDQKELERTLRSMNEELSAMAEEEVKHRLQSELKYEFLFNSINEGLIVHYFDENGIPSTFTEVNDRVCSMFGYSREELLNMSPKDFHIESEIPKIKEYAKEIFEGEHILFNAKLRARDGSVVDAQLTSNLVELDGRKAAITTLRDMRQIKNLQSEKERSDNIMEAAFSSAAIGICLIEPSGRFITMNDSYCSIFGYTKKELKGRHFSIVLPQSLREQCVLLYSQFADGLIDSFPSTWTCLRRDGNQIIVNATLAKIMMTDGEEVIVTTVQDITVHKELEEKQEKQEQMLIQQSKMASMGEMISVIAHQWKQPLNAVYLIAQFMPELVDEDSPNREDMLSLAGDIMKQVEFMNQTMDDFRNFFKPGKELKSFDVHEAVSDVIKLLKPQLEQAGIETRVTGDNDLSVVGQINEFKQVILNLISNAKDAIAARKAGGGVFHGVIEFRFVSDENVNRLEVADNGGGVPADIIEKVFEPYVSNKGNNGTGIGLSMSKTIIEENMNGKLTLRNEDEGAVFVIDFSSTG